MSALWCGGGDALVLSGRSDGFGRVKLWRSRMESGDLELLLERPYDLMASDCSPDGQQVVFTDYGGGPTPRPEPGS